MVLNGDSDHPNPFRPPMPFHNVLGIYYPYRIYKGHPDSITDTDPIKPRFNILTDSTFNWRLYLAAKKGFLFGQYSVQY